VSENRLASESRAEWSKLLCKTQSFETVAEKYLSSDVSTRLFTGENIFTVLTPKTPKNHQPHATKKKTSRCMQPYRVINLQLLLVHNNRSAFAADSAAVCQKCYQQHGPNVIMRVH